VNHKCVLFNKDCIFERYFQTLLSLVFKGFVFKLYFYYFMQAKPLCYAHKVLFRNIFYFENMFINSLKHCSEYLKALGICLI
jgi:hypothetical protein